MDHAGSASGRLRESLSGLAAMLVALPSAIAFGLVIFAPLGPEAAGAAALAGITGAVCLGLIAAACGGAPRLISGPCAPAAAVLAALVMELARDHASDPQWPALVFPLVALVGLLTGALQFGFGLAGGGRLIKFVPYPVVAGYLSAVGILIFTGQLPRFLGVPAGTGFWASLSSPSLWQGPAVVVGVTTISMMLVAARVIRWVPATIVGLAAGLGAYLLMGMAHPGLLTAANNPLVVGPVGGAAGALVTGFGTRWSALAHLSWQDWQHAFTPALMLAVLLSIDTLKTCVIMDAITRTRHNSNRALIGQGLANLTSAALGGIPGAGQMGPTLVNLNSGGMTRWSSLWEGLWALAVFLLLGQLVAWVPLAALAGILMVAAARMVDPNMFRLLRHPSTVLDFGVVVGVIVTALWWNLMAAAGVGLVLATFLFLREQIRSSVVRRKAYGDQMLSKKRRLPEEHAVLARDGRRTVICELQGSLFFGTTDQLISQLEADLKTCRHVILDFRRVQSMDFTATHLFGQMAAQLAARGGLLLLARMPHRLPASQDLCAYLHELEAADAAHRTRVFAELDEALEWCEEELLTAAQLRQGDQEKPLALAEMALFAGLDPESVAALRSCVIERAAAAAERVFVQGDRGDEIFLIRRGSVRIVLPLLTHDVLDLATFGRGDFFGEICFLEGGTRTASAIATAPTDLYVLSRSRFDDVATRHAGIGQEVYQRLARALALRLRQTDAELRAMEEA